MKRCSYCGRETTDEARRCWECGSEFNGTDRWHFGASSLARVRRWRAGGMVLVGAMMLSLLVYSAVRSATRHGLRDGAREPSRGEWTVLAENPNPYWWVVYRTNAPASNAPRQPRPAVKP